jgi:DnaJ family protein A protein 2
VANMDGFGAGSDDPRGAGGEWEDDDEDGQAGAQCAQQ